MLSDVKNYLAHCTDAELSEIEATVAQTKEARKKEQFTQLVRNFIQAQEELKKAFPTASCHVDLWSEDEVDLLEYDLSPSMFDR